MFILAVVTLWLYFALIGTKHPSLVMVWHRWTVAPSLLPLPPCAHGLPASASARLLKTRTVTQGPGHQDGLLISSLDVIPPAKPFSQPGASMGAEDGHIQLLHSPLRAVGVAPALPVGKATVNIPYALPMRSGVPDQNPRERAFC